MFPHEMNQTTITITNILFWCIEYCHLIQVLFTILVFCAPWAYYTPHIMNTDIIKFLCTIVCSIYRKWFELNELNK